MGKSRAAVFCALAIAMAAAPITSCLDATEIAIGVTANVDCQTVARTGVRIRIGSPASIDTAPSNDITSYACTSHDATTMNDLGTVVIVPSGSVDSLIAIEVILGIDPVQTTTSCLPEASGKPCIYARRQISFLPHTHVYLPIELDASCAGNLCVPGVSTCQAGVCVPIDVDPHDCGTQCTTGPDAVPTIDANPTIDSPVFDGPVFDSPADVSLESGTCNGTICGGVCVDLASNAPNCGACGFDCSGGKCVNGTCQLDATATGTCLTVYNNAVWIAAPAGLFTVPTKGGSATAVTKNNTFAIASTTGGIAWFEKKTSLTSPDLHDDTYSVDYTESGSAELLALSPKVGFAWTDFAAGYVFYQSAGTQNVPQAYFSFTKTTKAAVAVGAGVVYASLPSSSEIGWATSATTKGFASASSPGAIVVDKPTSTTPNVFYVDQGTQLHTTDYQLGNNTLVASSSIAMAAIAYDSSASAIVANMLSEIDIVKNGTFVQVVSGTNAVARCIGVDATGVYWLDQSGGVYKHVKP